jgi:DNA/RNA endonuclease G (NUC1)
MIVMRNPGRFLAACLLLTTALGCGRAVVRTRVAPGTTYSRPQAGPSTAERARMERICFMGCPKLDPNASGFGPATVVVARDGYVLEHSALEKIPLWVAEHVTAAQLGGNSTRNDKFQPDPLLKPGVRAELADYKSSGYDRGHQAPAGNQTRDEKLKAETFYLSNMVPQSPRMNQQIWRELETLARDWTAKYGETYQITGPMFYDPKEDDPQTADGTVSYKSIGKDQVAVPTHIFKIVLARRAKGGPWEAIAFVMENKPYSKPFQFDKYIQSIEWIERRTGIDFNPDMPLAEQWKLERAVPGMWQ